MSVINQLLNELKLYIDNNYIVKENIARKDETKEKDVSKDYFGKGIDLSELVNEVGDTFQERLLSLIDEKGLTDVEVYKKANIDRKLFSKIRSNPAYHPRKNTILCLAIALELSIEETNDLLNRAEYAFSPNNKGDLIIKFFVEHKIYDFQIINDALEQYNQPLLGE